MAKYSNQKSSRIDSILAMCLMQSTRRDFIKGLGISLASLILARCIPSGNGDDSPREHLRDCWLSMEKLAQETQNDYEKAEQIKQDLIVKHRSALDDLVESGELSPVSASQIQIAFQETSDHVWRSNSPITCYEPMMIDFTPTSRSQLTQQVSLLSELAESGEVDEATIAQAQAALEKDIAFLSLTNDETQALYDKLIAGAGESFDFPSFDELELEITPEIMEAARFLIELLIEDE